MGLRKRHDEREVFGRGGTAVRYQMRQRLLSIFVSESVALALAGGVLGIVVAIPVISGLTHRFIGLGIPLDMKVNPPAAGLSLLIALILGVVSGCVPAYRVSRLNIVDALRHIG